mmetsp:Transcript_64061/g.169720  ORF Transcript_64061/g.169720 Transcript_64061/m.169720 type:complete len:295 (+) Transcript_64061:2319-3203(+)
MRVASTLDVRHELLGSLRTVSGHHIKRGSIDENGRDVPHLVHIRQGPALNLFEHSRRDEPPDNVQFRKTELVLSSCVILHGCMFHGGERVLALVEFQEQVVVWTILQRIAFDDAVLHQVPSLRAKARLAHLGQGLSNGDLFNWRTSNKVLAPTNFCFGWYYSADLQDTDLATANANVKTELDVTDPCVEHVETLVNLDTTSRTSQHRGGHGPYVGHPVAPVRRNDVVVMRGSGVVDSRKVDRQSVATELDDVPAIGVNEVDQGCEERTQTLRKQLSSIAFLGQALRQRSETARI